MIVSKERYLEDPDVRLLILGPIFHEVFQERLRQDATWGGPAHDDKKSASSWIANITKCAGDAFKRPFMLPAFRAGMVEVAATAVAAIEWCDRKRAVLGPQITEAQQDRRP